MKVDVVRLRRNGVKLASGEVKASVPLRAVLSISTLNGFDQHGGEVRSTFAQLVDDAGGVVSTMAHAEVTSMSGDSFIVSGTEVSAPAIGAGEQWPQSWWCRVVR
jgi:hypothetical protein